MTTLTTHVLDTAQGKPAAGMRIELFHVRADGSRAHQKTVTTNDNGRSDRPLSTDIGGGEATYELRFHVAAYFRTQGVRLADPPFLDIVPIRFGAAERQGNYHVPLLVTPWSYSTYRGS